MLLQANLSLLSLIRACSSWAQLFVEQRDLFPLR